MRTTTPSLAYQVDDVEAARDFFTAHFDFELAMDYGVFVKLTHERDRLRAAGVPITLELQDDPWGERLFRVQDPNGIEVQLVQWIS